MKTKFHFPENLISVRVFLLFSVSFLFFSFLSFFFFFLTFKHGFSYFLSKMDMNRPIINQFVMKENLKSVVFFLLLNTGFHIFCQNGHE